MEIDGWRDYYSLEAWCEDLEAARNPVLRVYWLKNVMGVPAPPPQRIARFARLLLAHDREFQYHVMLRLSNWTATSEMRPSIQGFVDGELVQYPRFNELMSYWKKRFDIRG